MPYLIVHETGMGPRSFEITEDELLIGRGNDCGLVLSNVAVSRHHARITGTSDLKNVLDNLSENGTLLNDQPIDGTSFLSHGDAIRVSKYKLVFMVENECSAKEHQDLSLMSPYTARSGKEDSTHRISPEMQAKLRAVERARDEAKLVDASTSKAWKPGGGKTTVGGSPSRITAEGGFLSKGVIAELEWNGKGHVVKKVAMLGTVQVNGKAPGLLPLRDGDRVTVGKTLFTYVLPKA
jgi:pSer/pThr/pTyr-binding forkhead associated (FHA) protein